MATSGDIRLKVVVDTRDAEKKLRRMARRVPAKRSWLRQVIAAGVPVWWGMAIAYALVGGKWWTLAWAMLAVTLLGGIITLVCDHRRPPR